MTSRRSIVGETARQPSMNTASTIAVTITNDTCTLRPSSGRSAIPTASVTAQTTTPVRSPRGARHARATTQATTTPIRNEAATFAVSAT